MGNRCYLAMTGEEISGCEQFPEFTGWMACHFSSYGTGLSNLPQLLPENAMVIVNDRTPMQGHDPQRITNQLCALCNNLSPACILLDLQRPGDPQAQLLAQQLCAQLPCPVAVSEGYARDCDGAVFLSPCPILTPLEKYLAPWSGREIWLEAALQAQTVTVDTVGSKYEDAAFTPLPEPTFVDEDLCCQYHTQIMDDRVIFHLHRGIPEVKMLLQKAEKLGVSLAVGLYQQLKDFK